MIQANEAQLLEVNCWRRGIAAVDDLIAKGDVHVIRNNEPQYVVLSEERYQELVAEANEVYRARVRVSLEDVKAGRVKNYTGPFSAAAALWTDKGTERTRY